MRKAPHIPLPAIIQQGPASWVYPALRDARRRRSPKARHVHLKRILHHRAAYRPAFGMRLRALSPNYAPF